MLTKSKFIFTCGDLKNRLLGSDGPASSRPTFPLRTNKSSG